MSTHRSIALAALALLPACPIVHTGEQLEIQFIDGPTIRRSWRSATNDRLWIGDADGSRTCVMTAAGRFGCWGGDDPDPLAASLEALFDEAWIGCLSTQWDPGQRVCWRADKPPTHEVDVLDLATNGGLCVVKTNGRVACWQGGALTDVPGVKAARQVVLDAGVACARLFKKDRGVKCWGGPGPTRTLDLETVDLDALAGRVCAALADGGVACWHNLDTRTRRVAGITDAIDVELGAELGCARLASGGVACWDPRSNTPARPITGAMNLVELEVGRDFACGRDHSDALWCWGGNSNFALGDVTSAPYIVQPTRVPGLPAMQEVLLGPHGACARTTSGELWCWGADHPRPREMPDDGATIVATKIVPNTTPAVPGLPPVETTAVGGDHACARTSPGELWCWGETLEGQTATPPTGTRTPPQKLAGLPPILEVAAGAAHTCARSEAGKLWCWGRNTRGQLGRGDVSPWTATPTELHDLERVTSIVLHDDTSCAVADGGVYCWGDNAGRHASPTGPLHSAVAVPVDPSRIRWYLPQ